MKQQLLLAAACAVCVATASAQHMPDVLRPGDHVPVESKHLCSHASHSSSGVEAMIDKPSAIERRNYDVLNYNLYMDWTHPLSTEGTSAADRRYSGLNEITVRIDSANVTALVFDAIAMKIDSISITPLRSITIRQSVNELTVEADSPFEQGDTITLAVSYTITSAANRGFYLFPKGYVDEILPNGTEGKLEERLAYTMSEPYDARYWMPCNDLSYDKAMSSISVRVPKPFSVASNGLLQDVIDREDGTQVYHWKSFSPMATYLMQATASIFTEYQEWYHRVSNPADSIPVQYFIWQADYNETKTDRSSYNARNAFRNTVRMMEAFSSLYTEYPFEKYGMVPVQPFDFGGMEHQTMTTVHRNWLRTADQPGIAHELMHQWTGDLVTCASFKDIWLNEGGATFGEALWAEAEGGADAYTEVMLNKRFLYLVYPSNDIPAYNPAATASVFNYATTYAKAGWVYHMLRRMLGDDVFFPTMRKYLTEFAHQSIETKDMADFFEREVSNPPVPFSTFFEQWIYSAKHPVYKTSYNTYPKNGDVYPVTAIIEQTQSGTLVPDVFVMPLTLTMLGASGERETIQFLNDQRIQTLKLSAPFPVVNIVLNDDNNVLAETVEAVVGVAESEAIDAPAVVLAPNPVGSGGSFTIQLSQPESGPLDVELLDALGRPLASLYSGSLLAGTYRLNQNVPDVAPGMYFLRIVSGKKDTMMKLVITR